MIDINSHNPYKLSSHGPYQDQYKRGETTWNNYHTAPTPLLIGHTLQPNTE